MMMSDSVILTVVVVGVVLVGFGGTVDSNGDVNSESENNVFGKSSLVSRLKALESTVMAQNAKLADYDVLLQEQSRLLQSQQSRLQGQEQLLKDQDQQLGRLRQLLQQLEKKEKQPSDDTERSASRHVGRRGDDMGPLETVVSQTSQRVSQLEADLQAWRAQITSDLHSVILQQGGQASTFVHWGRSQCANNSELVYSGYVGGSYYRHGGAATNYLCLTKAPVFDNHAVPAGMAFLYGGEFETYDVHAQMDPVCAVCRSFFPTTIMVPGTNVCSPGWQLQYSGYLMAGNYAEPAGSEYICVDSSMETSMHSEANQNGVLLYYTVTACGSLPCSPYVNHKIVLCAVCSK